MKRSGAPARSLHWVGVSRLLSFAIFILVVLAVLGGMHYYLWARLVRDTALPEPWRRTFTVLIGLAAVAVPAAMFAARLLHRPLAKAFPMAVFVWLGLAFLLSSALLAIDLVRWVGAAAAWMASAMRRSADPPVDPARRLFVARAVAGGALVAAGAAGALGIRAALDDPEVSEVPVKLERLPRALSGYSIAQITDLHVGPTIGERAVERVVEATNRLRPDVIAVTGDLVDGSVPELRRAIASLSRLRARHGVYFVTGNHEYYSGAGPWLAELRRLGITVLRNERVSVGDRGPGGASFDLAGVDDWSVGRARDGQWPNLDSALAGRTADRSLVLLAHQPRGLDEAVRAGVELQISGHTHGGQIFPFTLMVAAVYPYVKGLHRHRHGDSVGQVFVSRGTGYWGPPMRLGNPPEIARIVLV